MDVIILWIFSVLLGGILAWRLTTISNKKSESQRNSFSTASEVQQSLREMLSRRHGFDSPKMKDKVNFDLFEIIATPIFAVTCLALGGIFWAHPDALPIGRLLDDFKVKPFILLVGQAWFFSMFVCSVILVISQRRK